MRQGVVIFRPPNATARRQSQTCLVLSHNGYSCHARQRYDNVLIVAFQRDKNEPDAEVEDVVELLKEAGVWDDEDTEVKAQG